jgi:predicted metal-dependent peptidase
VNEIKVTKAETKIRRGLEWLADEFPCFTSIVASWKVLESDQIQTMATDGKRLLWNRSFTDWCTNEEARWVILHEAGHVFLGHHLRCLGSDKETRNKALDLALNWLIESTCPPRLREMGCFPGSGSFKDLPGNEDAEFYLRKLQTEEPQDSQEDSKEDSQDSQDESEDSDGDSGQDQDQDGSESDSGDSQEDSGEDSEGSDSGQTGEPSSGESKPKSFDPSEAKAGDLGEVLEVTEEEAEEAEQAWEEIVSEGILAAEIAGKVPGWAKELQGKIQKKNTVKWYQRLKNMMQSLADNGSSFERPNRKTSWMSDCILPSNIDRNCGRGLILTDTSGSMSLSMMDSTLARIEEILREFPNVEVDMLQCDTRLVDRERTFTAADFPLKTPVEWMGRGGTDLNPALREASYKKAAKEWAWVIVISDMYWDLNSAINPGLPVFWVKTSPGSTWYAKPRFGECLEAAE